MTAAFCSISSSDRNRYVVLLSQLEGTLGYFHVSLPYLALKAQHGSRLQLMQTGQGHVAMTAQQGDMRKLFARPSRSGILSAHPIAPAWLRRLADTLALDGALDVTLRTLGLLRIAVLDSAEDAGREEP